MIEFGTWLSVVVLGPGALAIFGWFIWDIPRQMRTGKRRGAGRR